MDDKLNRPNPVDPRFGKKPDHSSNMMISGAVGSTSTGGIVDDTTTRVSLGIAKVQSFQTNDGVNHETMQEAVAHQLTQMLEAMHASCVKELAQRMCENPARSEVLALLKALS